MLAKDWTTCYVGEDRSLQLCDISVNYPKHITLSAIKTKWIFLVIITLLCITLCDIAADLIVVRHTVCRVDILYLFALLFLPRFFLFLHTKKTVPLCSCENSRVVFSFFFLLYMHRYLFFFLLQQNVFRLTFVSMETSLVSLFRLDYIQCLYNLSKEFNLRVEKPVFGNL